MPPNVSNQRRASRVPTPSYATFPRQLGLMGKTTTAWLILAHEPLPHSEIQQNSECDIPYLLPTLSPSDRVTAAAGGERSGGGDAGRGGSLKGEFSRF